MEVSLVTSVTHPWSYATQDLHPELLHELLSKAKFQFPTAVQIPSIELPVGKRGNEKNQGQYCELWLNSTSGWDGYKLFF